MVVDGAWPADYPGEKDGSPTYDDIVAWCVTQGRSVSRSAVARWAKGLRAIERMKTAGLIARNTMAGLTAEDAPQTQKAAAEMATALLLELMTSSETYSAKQLKEVAAAIRDCAAVSIKADSYARSSIEEKVRTAAASTEKQLGDAGVDRKLIQQIIDEHLGVIKP